MQMYRTFNPGNYESFDDIETIDDDFIHLAYGDATNKLRPSLIGTSKNKTVLKILSYSIQEDKFNTQKYEQENEIVHIIACDFLNKGKSLSYILICNDKTEKENDGNNDVNNNETENTEENRKYKVFCFTPGEESPSIEIGECDKMPILYSKGDWSNFLILQNGSTTTIYNYKDKLKSEKVTGFPNLAKDHSSGFIDIDGDLKSELVLVTEKNDKRYITIIDEYNKDFKIRQSINIPNETGPIGFGDFNASGAFDIVFISKEGNSHYLNILLNKRPAIENRERRGSVYLKYTDHSKYTDDPFSMTEDKYYHKVSLDIFDGLKPMMKACDKMLNGLPTGLLVADITINSYPDLILLMKDSNDKVHIRILENKFDCIDDNQTFVPLKIYPPDMNDILSVSIADVKKKGRDCLVVNRIHNGEYSIGNVESNISKDSYKIHVTTLRPGTRRGAYQGSVPGVSYKYKIDEDEIVRIGSQMNQFSHLSFQTPTVFLGLGSTNFFIDKFFLSGPSRTHFDKIYVLGSKVLPNSEIVLLPTEKGVITELYLSFGKNVINIVIVFSIVLLLNFILVIYTYKKEKDLEKKAKKRESYLFNFSAL